jgi:hypothetical protein
LSSSLFWSVSPGAAKLTSSHSSLCMPYVISPCRVVVNRSDHATPSHRNFRNPDEPSQKKTRYTGPSHWRPRTRLSLKRPYILIQSSSQFPDFIPRSHLKSKIWLLWNEPASVSSFSTSTCHLAIHYTNPPRIHHPKLENIFAKNKQFYLQDPASCHSSNSKKGVSLFKSTLNWAHERFRQKALFPLFQISYYLESNGQHH